MCDSDIYIKNNTMIEENEKVKHFEDNILFNPENKGKMVYMLFKADWCGACKMYKPEFLKYREICKTKGKSDMIMVIIDNESSPGLFSEYKIKGMPTTYIYKIDNNLLNNRHKKLELALHKIVGADINTLKNAMSKYSGIN